MTPLAIDLANLCLRRDAESRSISAENPRGERGAGAQATAATTLSPRAWQSARDLGPGWKCSPCVELQAGQHFTLMDVAGPGVIRHIWMAFDPKLRRQVILRFHWDGAEQPAIECPAGDFFCTSWNADQAITATPVNVNSKGGMNCFFPMPFRRSARITVHNDSTENTLLFFYTINYTLESVPEEALYFHAQFRRTRPLPEKQDYLILDGVRGRGHYVGTFMSWQQNSGGWWGEGEIKMFLDGDRAGPTICGTGTEDYFGGAWCFREGNYSAPCFGFQTVTGKSGEPGARMTMYRFHVHDPVFFRQELRVTMQALGWREGARYLPLQDDIASVAYWYQTLPTAPFPVLPDRNQREII
jgi:hypothetical protein